jgi:cell division protease FtsH
VPKNIRQSSSGGCIVYGVGEHSLEKLLKAIDEEGATTPLTLNHSDLRGGELESLRKELFIKGSEFRPATRDQLVGIEGSLQEIDNVINALVYSEIYSKHGARLEPGVILTGTPGTGKTTSARYLATASGACFVNVRDWPHNGQLLTDADIRSLFYHARQAYQRDGVPILLFWDEFEGVARNRSDAPPEIAAVVSQLTSELDGVVGKNTGLLLVGCTNYSHQIDPALKRAGRMGLEIEFGPPDTSGKAALLDHYLKGYTHGSVDTDALALCFSPNVCAAEIEEACQHAWRYAVRRAIGQENDNPQLNEQDLQHVFLERLIGPPANFATLSDEERLWIAVHEVGHALGALGVGTPVSLLTVRAGEHSLGKVITRPRRDHTHTLLDFERQIVTHFGGVAAGDVCDFPRTTGIQADLVAVNDAALELVEEYAACQDSLGWLAISNLTEERGHGRHPDFDPKLAAECDREIREYLDRGYSLMREIIEQVGKESLLELSHWMLAQITVTGSVFEDKLIELTGSTIQPFEYFSQD